MSGQQRQELKEILKQISAKHKFTSNTLYYKQEDESLRVVQLSKDTSSRMKEIIFSPNLQYGVYIDTVHETMRPSKDCFDNSGDYYGSIVIQFVPLDFIHRYSVNGHIVNKEFIENVIGVKPLADYSDPISQIFAYRRVFSAQPSQHVYVCTDVYPIEPYDKDPTSIFHGKKGIIAYCMTLRNLILMETFKEVYSFDILEDGYTLDDYFTSELISAFVENNYWQSIWNEDMMEACDIDFIIKNNMRDMIKEAKRLMRRCGIIRIVFPLD